MPTVLLVEEERVLLENLRYALELAGYTVLSAVSGEAAVRICHRHPGKIDVLISDVVMKGLTGFELAAIVRTAYPNAIVILMSGSSRETVSQSAIVNDFLEKPFAHQELLAAISRHWTTAAGLGAIRASWN